MDRLRRFIFTPRIDPGPGFKRYARHLMAASYNKVAYRSIPYYKKNGTLLDVGCGLGSYLSMIQKIGWKGVGIELNKRAARYGREILKLDIRTGMIDDFDFPEKSFDVITMWHSIEHFTSPKQALIKAGRIIKDDGLILISTPNYDSLDRMIFKANWNGLEVPLHLYYFTPATIQRLLVSAGFTIERVVHTIRPADMKKSIVNVMNERFNPHAVLKVKKFAVLPALILAPLFAILEKSSIMTVHAKKARKSFK